MDDLLADALDETAAETEGPVMPYRQAQTRCWEMKSVEVLADLGLSDGQIARYLRASETEIAALRRKG